MNSHRHAKVTHTKANRDCARLKINVFRDDLKVFESIYATLSFWTVVAPCFTLKPHPHCSLVTEPSACTMRSCGLLFSSMGIVLHCWSLSTTPSQVPWQQEGVIYVLTSDWVLFPLPGVLNVSPLAYLWHCLFCVTHDNV